MQPSNLSDRNPGAAQAQPATEGVDADALRTLMRGGSKTFFAASLLLPARVRAPATALYAFCRLADDAIDLGEDKHAAVALLQRRLDAIYRGQPEAFDADRALAPVVARYAIPRALLDALIEGFVWDANGRHYETLADLQAYGARVAGTVGAMMAHPLGGESAHPWIRWSYILFGLSGLIWAIVLVPIQLKQRALLARTDRITPEYLQLSRIWQITGAVATLLPLPILYFMVSKAV